MKHLYIWNDLKVFYSFRVDEIDRDFLALIELLEQKQKDVCRYTLWEHAAYERWLKTLPFPGGEPEQPEILTIGTRPGISLDVLMGAPNIRLQRHLNPTGRTDHIDFIGNSKQVLLSCAQDHKPLHVVEDVAVCGATIDKILATLDAYGYHGTVVFYIFAANCEAIRRLIGQKRGFSVQFRIHYEMEGVPIEESTLLCMYDLLFGTINGQPYVHRDDLMQKFFFEYTGQLKRLVRKSQNLIVGEDRQNGACIAQNAGINHR